MEDNTKQSNEQIRTVAQQLNFPLDKVSQDIIRRYSGGEAFPIGAVFISTVSTDPSILLGYGTWSAIGAGRVLVGIDSGDADFDTLGETGGAKTHTLTIAEMPSHDHNAGGSVPRGAAGGSLANGWGGSSTNQATLDAQGGGGAHNNVQPYLICAFWQRTA
jgi:hypothetical protein